MIQHLLDRIRAEYTEMPGMSLSVEQVARLCGTDAHTCQSVLNALVDARFLRVTADGAYVRLTGNVGNVGTPRTDAYIMARRRAMRGAS
jgi:hypothetical protein